MNEDKYQHLFEWSVDAFNKEIQRFKRIDQKASRYLSALTLLAGVTGFFVDAILSRLLPFEGALEWIIAVLTLSLVLLLAVSWWLVFGVLKVSDIKALPLNEEVFDFYQQNNLVDIRFAMSKKIALALEENRSETDRKAGRLTNGYYLIATTLICLALLTGAFSTHRWKSTDDEPSTKKGEVTMAKSDKQKTNQGDGSNGSDSGEPNPDVEAPDFPTMNEGYKPDSTRKRSEKGSKGRGSSEDSGEDST